MTRTPVEATSASGLGDAVRSLRDSAGDLSTDLTELNRAVDDLQASTARCSETQRSASVSLTRAAERLSVGARTEPTTSAERAPPTPADD